MILRFLVFLKDFLRIHRLFTLNLAAGDEMTVINKKGGTMELKLLFTPLILFSILYMNSCATLTLYYGEYNIELKKVERPVKAKKRYGEQKISILKEYLGVFL